MENLCLYSLAKSVSPNILCCSKLWCGTGKVQVAQRERERERERERVCVCVEEGTF